MFIIGLCGGSGAGKSEAAKFFASRGIPVIDADVIYRSLTVRSSSCVDELAEVFSDKARRPDGSLDRKYIASLVFGKSAEAEKNREKLNSIAHKYVIAEAETQFNAVSKVGIKIAVFDAPQLFESGADKFCSVTVCIVADRNVRVKRIMKRDGIKKKDAEARIDSQFTDDYFTSKCDYTIENNGSGAELCEKLERCIADIKKRAGAE